MGFRCQPLIALHAWDSGTPPKVYGRNPLALYLAIFWNGHEELLVGNILPGILYHFLKELIPWHSQDSCQPLLPSRIGIDLSRQRSRLANELLGITPGTMKRQVPSRGNHQDRLFSFGSSCKNGEELLLRLLPNRLCYVTDREEKDKVG